MVVETQVITAYGRKVPLLEIRRQMLTHHEKYMHLLSDADIKQLSEDDNIIKVQLTKCGVSIEASMNLESLQDALSQIQRTRHLVIWHDHATVLGSGYILVTVHALYDEAVYLSDQEYQEKVGQAIHKGYVQHHIEEPYTYIMAASSSSKDKSYQQQIQYSFWWKPLSEYRIFYISMPQLALQNEC